MYGLLNQLVNYDPTMYTVNGKSLSALPGRVNISGLREKQTRGMDSGSLLWQNKR